MPPFSISCCKLYQIFLRTLRTHPPSRLSAVSEDLPRSRVEFHGSLVRPSASGRVARFWLVDHKALRFAYKHIDWRSHRAAATRVVRDAASPFRPGLTSCARQPYQRSNRLSPSPGGAQTRQTEINVANYTTFSRTVAHSSQRTSPAQTSSQHPIPSGFS